MRVELIVLVGLFLFCFELNWGFYLFVSLFLLVSNYRRVEEWMEMINIDQ